MLLRSSSHRRGARTGVRSRLLPILVVVAVFLMAFGLTTGRTTSTAFAQQDDCEPTPTPPPEGTPPPDDGPGGPPDDPPDEPPDDDPPNTIPCFPQCARGYCAIYTNWETDSSVIIIRPDGTRCRERSNDPPIFGTEVTALPLNCDGSCDEGEPVIWEHEIRCD